MAGFPNMTGDSMVPEPTYVAWRTAGEVFGRLNESLLFGDLIMFTRRHANAPYAIAFQWKFSVGTERYFCEECVVMLEIQYLRSPAAFADHLAARWKNEHRLVTEKTDEVV